MKYDQPIIVTDVETGGLPARLKKKATIEVALTEIAFVVIDNVSLEIIDRKSWLFKPYSDGLIYELEAEKVSGISKSYVQQNGLDMAVAFNDIEAFLKKHKRGTKKPYLCGHNIIDFDLEFIMNLFEMNKRDASDYFDDFILDTLKLSRVAIVEAPKFNLGACCELFNIEHTQAHRALTDTVATAKLIIEILKRLRSEGSETKNQKKYRHSFQF
jgi:DNA polymerase III alpha subunit (gram-positive type)